MASRRGAELAQAACDGCGCQSCRSHAASANGNGPRPGASAIRMPSAQLEAFVLQTFIQSMLPKNATHVFGKGTAGEVWKSMLAEKLGHESRAADRWASPSACGLGTVVSRGSCRRAATIAAPPSWRASCPIRNRLPSPVRQRPRERSPDAGSRPIRPAGTLRATGLASPQGRARPAGATHLWSARSSVWRRSSSRRRRRSRPRGDRSQGLQQPQEPGPAGAQSRPARARRSTEGQRRVSTRLAGLRAKLEVNRAVLKTHLDGRARGRGRARRCDQGRRIRTAPIRRRSGPAAAGYDQADPVRAVGVPCDACLDLRRRVLAAPRAPEPEARDRRSSFGGLESVKTRMISVPVVADGAIHGYVMAQFVFTVDSKT